MGKKNTTIRFAFGSPEKPESSVWRAIINNKGDIFINNEPGSGAAIHIALHSSGKFSFKLGSLALGSVTEMKRHSLEPPVYFKNERVWQGPCIFFQHGYRNIPPPPPSGKVNKIIWLGSPQQNQIMCIETYYDESGRKLIPRGQEFLIGNPVKAAIFKKPMLFQMVVKTRELVGNEIGKKPEEIGFPGALPEAMELITVAKTQLGTSAITIAQFHAKLKK